MTGCGWSLTCLSMDHARLGTSLKKGSISGKCRHHDDQRQAYSLRPHYELDSRLGQSGCVHNQADLTVLGASCMLHATPRNIEPRSPYHAVPNKQLATRLYMCSSGQASMRLRRKSSSSPSLLQRSFPKALYSQHLHMGDCQN